MSQSLLNILSVVFSICSFVFFLVGCIGYASGERTMKNVAWITINDNGLKVWADLAGLFMRDPSGGTGLYLFGNCADGGNQNSDLCSTCLKDGNAAFALIIIATVFAMVNVVMSGILISAPNSMMQLGNMISAFMAGCFSLIGFGLFMGDCYIEFDHAFSQAVHYGPGAIIVLLGLLMMWVTFFFQVGAVAVGNK